MAKRALITGITGQDGAYLAKLLLEKQYKVYGAVRRTSSSNLHRLEELGYTGEVDGIAVTRMLEAIRLFLANIRAGRQQTIELGNLDAKRDWGFAGDYIQGMWQMLQQPAGDDFVLATNTVFSVRDFVDCAGKSLDFDIAWAGEGIEEKGFDRKTGKPVVTVSEALFRPAEVDLLIGDFAKARMNLAWKPKTSFPSLVNMMTGADYDRVKSDRVFF